MATIIYLHGFASAGISPKSDALVAAFGREYVFAPDLPVSPEGTVAIVTALVREARSYPLIFVGTSLGGFWANYFAQKFNSPCIMVNPSMNPGKAMTARVGSVFRNHKTGEEFSITQEHAMSFERCRTEALAHPDSELVNLFLAKDDEVIDYRETCTLIPRYKSRVITPDGGHRYSDHWEMVVDKARELAGQAAEPRH
ncbi:MAG: hypothetical protein PHP85_07135 [Gallionella sp.]|nr:hypothetical protein [Gallionella sp.]